MKMIWNFFVIVQHLEKQLLLISKLAMSKYYYVSNENMSDIKQSIQQYSQNFEQSNAKSNYEQSKSNYYQSIAEDLSHSNTHKLQSQSLAQKNPSKKHMKATAPVPTTTYHQQSVKNIIAEEPVQVEEPRFDVDRPADLGYSVWETIQDRYFETNKISTDDPDVLYDFYLLQKKTIKPRPPKQLGEQYSKLEKLMPSMRRKMQVKLDFERILLYKTEDVLYTLQVASHMRNKDKLLKKNENVLNTELKKTEKKKKKPINEVVNRLYGQTQTTGFQKMTAEVLQKIRLAEFGKKLSEAYQNAMRQFGDRKIQTLSKLYNYWEGMYDREQYGLDWKEETAQQDIRTYMIDQVATLKDQYSRKIGYDDRNGNKLLKFYAENPSLPGVYIPLHSFAEYVDVYNLYMAEKEEQEQKKNKEFMEKEGSKRYKSEVKKFGRPISATPLTILAKPKTKNPHEKLYDKYRDDRMIKTLMVEDRLSVPRYPFQYGTHDIVDELKTKGRVVPKPKVNYDQAITKVLTQTIENFSGCFLPQSDRVLDILESDSLYKDQTWKQEGEILHEAMLVKSYEQDWFREPIVKYMKLKGKDVEHETDKIVFKKLFKYLNQLHEDDRDSQLDSLRRYVDTARQLAKRKQGLLDMEKKDPKTMYNERKLMYMDLLERVKLFVRRDFQVRTGRSQEKLNKRQFLNETFSLLMKNHKEAVKKYFNVIEVKNSIEDKQCPKLLRYEFYRLCKEINPENYERDERPRAPNWVPTRQNPDSFNYKTFNSWAKLYKKDKNIQPADPEPEERGNTLWGQKKGKDRELLMMTFDDAKQCYFHPKRKKLQ